MLSLHASAFAYEGLGCLVVGESGAGKSRLLAQAMVHGALLIADDRVQLTRAGDALVAQAPKELAGVLELRGLGIVRAAQTLDEHRIHTVIALEETPVERLPEHGSTDLLGVSLPRIVLPPAVVSDVSTLLLYLAAMRSGRILPLDWRPAG
jgi:HPr kinase/phosphorylase